MTKICKRCGAELPPKPAKQRVCQPCREGKGQLFDVHPTRWGPEIPTGVERNRKKH